MGFSGDQSASVAKGADQGASVAKGGSQGAGMAAIKKKKKIGRYSLDVKNFQNF